MLLLISVATHFVSPHNDIVQYFSNVDKLLQVSSTCKTHCRQAVNKSCFHWLSQIVDKFKVVSFDNLQQSGQEFPTCYKVMTNVYMEMCALERCLY